LNYGSSCRRKRSGTRVPSAAACRLCQQCGRKRANWVPAANASPAPPPFSFAVRPQITEGCPFNNLNLKLPSYSQSGLQSRYLRESRKRWNFSGSYFETCNCDVACPCVFQNAPTKGACTALLAWHIDQGCFGDQAAGIDVP
jgi:hypothetical protein